VDGGSKFWARPPWLTTPPHYPPSRASKRVPICSPLKFASVCMLTITKNRLAEEIWDQKWDADAFGCMICQAPTSSRNTNRLLSFPQRSIVHLNTISVFEGFATILLLHSLQGNPMRVWLWLVGMHTKPHFCMFCTKRVPNDRAWAEDSPRENSKPSWGLLPSTPPTYSSNWTFPFINC